MRILVTGNKSYLGQHLMPLLARSFSGSLISVCDQKDGQDYRYLNGFEFDVVIHLGALSTIINSTCRADELLDINAFGLQGFFHQNKVRQFIFPSTGGAIYGNRTKPAKEEEATWQGCINPYSQSKYIAERIIKAHCLRHTILRLGNVYGGDMDGRTEALVLTHFKYDNPIIVYGGNQTRDFVHIDVVANAIINAINFDVTGTFNIASGESIKLLDIAKQFSKQRNVPIEIKDHRPEEMVDVALDVTAARKAGLIPKKVKNDYFIT